jgi:hypothetical protein
MHDICTIDTLWEEVKDSEMKKTLSPADEEACTKTHNPQKARQSKSKERFLRHDTQSIRKLHGHPQKS